MTTRIVTYRLHLERLVRHVHQPDGRCYAHHCTLGVFEQVVGYLDDHPDQATHTQALRRVLALPSSQVQVALEFLVERGLLTRRGRLVYPLSPCLDEEARAQFGYLAQTGD